MIGWAERTHQGDDGRDGVLQIPSLIVQHIFPASLELVWPVKVRDGIHRASEDRQPGPHVESDVASPG